jgi:hypothetical protein
VLQEVNRIVFLFYGCAEAVWAKSRFVSLHALGHIISACIIIVTLPAVFWEKSYFYI